MIIRDNIDMFTHEIVKLNLFHCCCTIKWYSVTRQNGWIHQGFSFKRNLQMYPFSIYTRKRNMSSFKLWLKNIKYWKKKHFLLQNKRQKVKVLTRVSFTFAQIELKTFHHSHKCSIYAKWNISLPICLFLSLAVFPSKNSFRRFSKLDSVAASEA